MISPTSPRKSLTINPLKIGASAGTVLAFLGLRHCLPVSHGVRGCASFSKLFFMRHFREPIPLQTTAVDQFATILGSDERIIEALKTVVLRHQPEIIGLVSTALTEFQGADIVHTVEELGSSTPELATVAIVPVAGASAADSLEAGFAHAVESMISRLVRSSRVAGTTRDQVNVLASSALTPGDIDELKAWIGAFGLRPIVVPDLSDSVDGHQDPTGYSPITLGGTPREAFAELGKSIATIVVGASLEKAADLLRAQTGVPDVRFLELMSLESCDELTDALHRLAGRPVPAAVLRDRARLLDAMVDCQFYTATQRAGVAAEGDLATGLATFLSNSGLRVGPIVTSAPSPRLRELNSVAVLCGDLDDFEREAKECCVDLLVANSHALSVAERLGVPLLRAGYPQHDFVGAHAKAWIGYRGSRQILFDVSNRLADGQRKPIPYASQLRGTDGMAPAIALAPSCPAPVSPERCVPLETPTPEACATPGQSKSAGAKMIRIAFASDNCKSVNQHFGAAEQFVIYDVVPGRATMVGIGQFVKARMKGAHAPHRFGEAPPPPEDIEKMNEDKVIEKIQFLHSCAAVYASKIGSSSIKRLMQAEIQPIIVNDDHTIGELLNEVSLGLSVGGLSWIDRAVAHPKPLDELAPVEGAGIDSPTTHELITSFDEIA